MEGVARPRAVALLASATSFTVAGLWLHLAGGRPTPAGFFQFATVAVGAGALGTFILWHRPRHRYGMTHLAIGVLFGTVIFAAGVLSSAGTSAAMPSWSVQVALAWSWVAAGVLLPLWVLVIAGFPDGTLHRSGLRRATVALAVAMPILSVVAYLLSPTGEPPPLIPIEPPADVFGPLAPAGDPDLLFRIASTSASVLGALAPIAAVVALLHRFRRAAPVQRQQIKWLLAGAAISVSLQAIPIDAIDAEPLRIAARVLVLLAIPLPLVAAAIAIFKHRLWEIDVVISKGLVYALASGVMTVLFLGIALIAGVTVGGRDTRVVAALGLALLVSFLAQPLRQRLERLVARLLYGEEPRGLVALTELGELASPSIDPRRLGRRIADAARGALGAPWAGVWLYVEGHGSGTLRPLAVSGAEPGPPALLPARISAALAEQARGVSLAQLPAEVATSLRPLFVDGTALVAPLLTADGLIGLIACGGERPKGTAGDEELELVAVVARQSALALRNISLEEELRQRLEQIQQQAAELHSSRQRLVAAQHQERRRIERDLHDGAQQQLVALAAQLRRAARGDLPASDAALAALADEAEEAVFALQELGRGIYPSLLTDRGLYAALQAHAARVPASVRVDVEPGLHGRRLEPELEAAFYFVGLEAMTNAVKHAPGAHIIISLRADPAARTVTLEVHDDGTGFDPGLTRQGTGLQNMADRIDALGGVLSVESAPGEGTWVRAEVQELAEVRDLTDREATPGGR